jgi:outer membrane protein TolC
MIHHGAEAAAQAANARSERFFETVCHKSGRVFWRRGLYRLAVALLLGAGAVPLFAGEGKGKGTAIQRRNFTVQEAVETALQRNPDILHARQEIERTKGLVIEVRARALPHLDATAAFQQTDSNLDSGGGNFTSSGTTTGTGASPTPTPTTTTTTSSSSQSTFSTQDRSYSLRFQVSQLLYSGGQVTSALRAADFTRDITYFQLRDTVDRVIATVRTQFYQVLLDQALIGVQEESVKLLESQLGDAQNRFEAGTVPRFNVLRAEVELSNQRAPLIQARNDYRIAQLQLAKTLGLDFEPGRSGEPLTLRGALSFERRNIGLGTAIELAKERRPFLKQQRINILNQAQQVRIALAGYQPTVSLDGGYLFRKSNFSDDLRDVVDGWFFGLNGSWAIFDGFETAGKVKQARAILEEAKITYDDAVRQVELEVQQAYSRLEQGGQLIESQAKGVEQADEALRLAGARLNAGAGTQLEVLDARVALTRAQSTRLQALFDYDSALAEFDRVTATDTKYDETFDDPLTRKRKAPRAPAQKSRRETPAPK